MVMWRRSGARRRQLGMCGVRGIRSSNVTSTNTLVFNVECGVMQLILQGLWYVAGTSTDPSKRHLTLRLLSGFSDGLLGRKPTPRTSM